MKFIAKLILKILALPVIIAVSILVWVCTGLIACSSFLLILASSIFTILGFLSMFLVSVKNGIIILIIAFLISPMGLPLLAIKLLGIVEGIAILLKDFVFGKKTI